MKNGIASPTIIITVTLTILIGIMAGIMVINVTQEPYMDSAERMSNITKEQANISLGNFSFNIEFSGRAYDRCGNEKGYSSRNPDFNDVSSIGVPIYPEYYECVSKDCCRGFVYEQILDFGEMQEDKFVYLDYWLSIKFLVNSSVIANCDPFNTAGCCPQGYMAAVGPAGVSCFYLNACDVFFYYSESGKDKDWEKFYLDTPAAGRNRVILPIAEEFKFVKLLVPKGCYLGHAEGTVVPWSYKITREDVCNEYYPYLKGVNHFYNTSGEPIREIINLTPGHGYIINVKKGGKWS